MRLRETLQHMRQHALAVIVGRAEPDHAEMSGMMNFDTASRLIASMRRA